MIVQFASRRVAPLWLAACVLASPGASGADDGKRLPAEDFTRPSRMTQISFAPDGKHFASISALEEGGPMLLNVVDTASRDTKTYRPQAGLDVASYRWLTNDLIEMRTTRYGARKSELGGRDFARLYVSIGGKSPESMSLGSVLRNVPGSSTDLIVAEGGGWVHIVDSTTGEVKQRITADVPGPHIAEWAMDNQLALRAGWSWNGSTRRVQVWARDAVGSEWKRLIEYDPVEERGFYPVAVDADGSLLVMSDIATGRFALHRLDRATGRPGEVLVGHPSVNIAGTDLRYTADRLEPIGVTVQADKPETYWFDAERDKVQRTVDASLPSDNVNLLQFLADGRVLVQSYGPREPGVYYFFDPKARSMSEWAWSRARPWLKRDDLGVMSPMHFRARDGLDIPAYVTLPPRRVAKALPLIVWVHGGPQSRDEWDFDPFVQFFATRGYAVLQVNFRGSTGFGQDFMRAGFKQWGQAMQDDLADGVQALVDKGVVDAKRVCIAGASYGGYAALMGPIRSPALYRCAIDQLGPTDVAWSVDLPEVDYNWYPDRQTDRELKARIGDPGNPAERRVMEANSPRLLADRIKVPVLLIYGTDDDRVPLRHGTAMKDALEAAHATFEWKSYRGEGHGIRDAKNQPDLLRTMERFLDRYNPAGE